MKGELLGQGAGARDRSTVVYGHRVGQSDWDESRVSWDEAESGGRMRGPTRSSRVRGHSHHGGLGPKHPWFTNSGATRCLRHVQGDLPPATLGAGVPFRIREPPMTTSRAQSNRSRPLAAISRAARRGAILVPLVVSGACRDAAAPDMRPSLSAKVAPTTQPRVDSLLANAVRRYGLPGMVAAIIRDGGIVAQGAAGIRHVGFPDAISVADRFHLGSNVKAMTSTMIATLVDDGKLRWSSTPASVFPELAASMNPELANATLERILQHRSGLPGFTEEAEFASVPPLSGTEVEQRRQFAAWVLQRPPAVPPGSYLYSNAGYVIAGAMAERVMGVSWMDLMQARVFGPLGMTVSRGWPAATDPAQPWGHLPLDGAYVPLDPTGDAELLEILGPAGDITMSVQEYAKFIWLNLRALRNHLQLVSAQGFTTLFTPNGDYALGWQVGVIGDAPFVAHQGSAGVFRALVLIFPTRNIAVAVLVNAGGDEAARVAVEVGLNLAGVN